jgi:polysaccharide export outer membrane protein
MGKKMKPLIQQITAIVFCLWACVSFAQDAYTLSPGDEVSITVFGEPDLSMSVKLDGKGVINFPLLGAVNAQGLTVSELEGTITRELTGAYLVNPDVRVSVAEYREVFINGEVNSPGGYVYKPGLTLDKAIALAGGFSEKASKERIILTRVINGVSQQFSMRSTDTVLPGDIISVSEYLQIFVNGEVQRPGNYPYQSGLTLEKTIALAGGFTGRASKKRIKVSRDIDGQQQQGRIRMSDPVYPGDIVSVPEGFF